MKDKCLTNLIITGNKETINTLKERFLIEQRLQFEKIIPFPENIQKTEILSDAKSRSQFIAWTTENWGTADWPREQYYEEEETTFVTKENFKPIFQFRMYYTTDKTPAKQIVSKLAELFPELTFVHNSFSTDTHEALHEVYENGDLVESTVPEWEEFAQNEFDYFVEDEENQPLPFTSNQREYD